MRNIFKNTGFDTLIGKNIVLNAATMILAPNTTTVIDGEVFGSGIKVADQGTGKPDLKTMVVVNGNVNFDNDIDVPNVVVTGEVHAAMIICEGTLAIKAGAKITANEIRYRDIVIENGAIVLAKMTHLDYISAGEQV